MVAFHLSNDSQWVQCSRADNNVVEIREKYCHGRMKTRGMKIRVVYVIVYNIIDIEIGDRYQVSYAYHVKKQSAY